MRRKILILIFFLVFIKCGPSTLSSENSYTKCQDHIDNDNDGLVDCEDEDCKGFAFCVNGKDGGIDVVLTDDIMYDVVDTEDIKTEPGLDKFTEEVLNCIDGDGDGYGEGPGCIDIDCDDTSPACTTDCTDFDGDGIYDCKDSCIDRDGDGYGTGVGCLGLDCDDNDTNNWTKCTTCHDFDLDGWYINCNRYETIQGPDCDDDDSDNWMSCATCKDEDNDGYYYGCDDYINRLGPDVDDTNPNCDIDLTDNDGDGYCANHDVDDTDPNCTSPVDVCNGRDDNCNGQIDEGFDCVQSTVTTARNNCGQIVEAVCSNECTVAYYLNEEICSNNLDDDCDNEIDEGDCWNTEEWRCAHATFSDLGLSCQGTCILNDTEFTCDTAYNDPDHGCNGDCLYISTGWTGFCGYIWITKFMTVPSQAPILRFWFKNSGSFWASHRGVSIEVLGRPETHIVVVECIRGMTAITCSGVDPGGTNTSWTEHSIDLSDFIGETIKVTLYVYDVNDRWCDMGDHFLTVFAKDFQFSSQ